MSDAARMAASRMSNEISTRVVARVKAMRKKRNMSMEQLAALMTEAGFPMGRMQVNNRENAGARPTIDEVVGYTVVFGVSIDDLIAEKSCEVCDGTPPPRFTCTECGKTGEETTLARRIRLSDELQAAWPDRALPTNEWLRNAIDDTHTGETE